MATSLSMSSEGLPPYSEADLFHGPQSRPTSRLSRSASSKSMETLDSDYSDAPPRYSASVTMRGRLNIKQELVTPFRKAIRRAWRLAEFEIDNTQLKITSIVGGIFKQTLSYTLQFAEVGLASDYTKKEHMIRLRVEARQYLIQCESRNEMLRWLIALQMAICLALPLELRTLPEDSKRRRNKLRERERREQRQGRLREALQATMGSSRTQLEGTSTAQQEPTVNQNASEHRPTHNTKRLERKRQRDPFKWNPRTRQSRFSEKDYPHLLFGTTWEGKDVLYHGRWALVSNQEIFFLVTPRRF